MGKFCFLSKAYLSGMWHNQNGIILTHIWEKSRKILLGIASKMGAVLKGKNVLPDQLLNVGLLLKERILSFKCNPYNKRRNVR